jgi:hypothetical protein
MENPMESKENNSRLFYLTIALIVLGFIASLAFPINAQERRLRDAKRFSADFIPSADNRPPASEIAATSTKSRARPNGALPQSRSLRDA